MAGVSRGVVCIVPPAICHVVQSDDEQTENDLVSVDGDKEKDEGYGQGGGGGEKDVRGEDSEADLRKEDGGVQGEKSPFVKHSLSLPVEPLPQRAVLRQNIPLLSDLSPTWSRRKIAFQKAPTSGLYSSVAWCMRSLPRPLQEVDYLRTWSCPMTPALCSYNCSTMQLCPFLLPLTTPLYSLQLTRSGTFNFTVEC